jgi:hypothetical protein
MISRNEWLPSAGAQRGYRRPFGVRDGDQRCDEGRIPPDQWHREEQPDAAREACARRYVRAADEGRADDSPLDAEAAS